MIDINRNDFYRHNQPEFKERTKNRLLQLQVIGMEEVGVAQFGVSGVMSGLYIEMVWSYSDKEWNDYLEWAQSVINKPRL